MNRTIVGLCVALAATTAAGTAQAQLIPNFTPFSFEVNGFAGLPRGDLEDRGAESAFGVGGEVTYHLGPALGVYGGYSRIEFPGEGESRFTDSGFSAGVRLDIPTPLIPIDPWIRGGAVFRTLETSGLPTGNFESDRETGYEVAAGIGLGFLPKLTITPFAGMVKYAVGAIDVEYLKAGVGVRLRL